MAHPAPPTNTNFQIYFLLTQLLEALYEDLPVYSIKFEVYHHFSGLSFKAEVSFWRPLKTVVSCNLFIRECGSTLYIVGLAHTAPPINTNFRLTFLLTLLQEALYENLPVSIKFEVYHHFSGLSFIAEVNFWPPLKIIVSYDFFIIIIIIINFFRWVFSKCTEALSTSLIPLVTILPEICVFIIFFSCTGWTKMRS